MVSRKRKKVNITVLLLLTALLLAVAALSGVFTAPESAAAFNIGDRPRPPPWSVFPPDSGNDTQPIRDWNGRPLRYIPQLGLVFTPDGIVTDENFNPVMFNESTQEFTTADERSAELVRITMIGMSGYTLQFGNCAVRSVNIRDNLFLVGLRPNTPLNASNEVRDILLLRTRRTGLWYDTNYLLTGRAVFDYADMRGIHVPEDFLVSARLVPAWLSVATLIGGTVTGGPIGFAAAVVGLNVVNRVAHAIQIPRWGTIEDLSVEIRRLMDEGLLTEDLALCPTTNLPVVASCTPITNFVKVRICPFNNQLRDYMGNPVISTRDARPVWWDGQGYIGHFGEPVAIHPHTRLLGHGVVEGGVFVSWTNSVRTFGRDPRRLYNVYINILDEQGNPTGRRAQIPATAVNVGQNAAGHVILNFYDMRGNRITEPELHRPDGHPITDNDREEHWPEEFDAPRWVRDLPLWLRNIINMVRNILDLPNTNIGWIVAAGATVLLAFIAFALFISVIILICVLMYFALPYLPAISKFVGFGVKGLGGLLSLPFKIQPLFGVAFYVVVKIIIIAVIVWQTGVVP